MSENSPVILGFVPLDGPGRVPVNNSAANTERPADSSDNLLPNDDTRFVPLDGAVDVETVAFNAEPPEASSHTNNRPPSPVVRFVPLDDPRF